MATTAILMSDNRLPLVESPRAGTLTYPALAFALNALYACRHGYDLLYFRMTDADCRHVTQGVRHASYCKLPAIAHALERYSTVAFIDSDSFFLQRNMSLPTLLQHYAPPAHATSHGPVAAWFANDLPQLGERANGGFHVWQARTAGSHGEAHDGSARRLLRTWWHLPAGRFGTEHDYEQHALQWMLSQLRSAVPRMATLQLRAMADEFTHAVAHIDHTKHERRLWVMSLALVVAALEAPTVSPPTLAPMTRARLAQLLQQANALAPTAEPPSALRARALRAAAELLRGGLDVPASPASLFSPDGVRCSAHPTTPRPLARSPAGRLHAFEYNATAMGMRVLPATDLIDADGLTLTLLPCAPIPARGTSGADATTRGEG